MNCMKCGSKIEEGQAFCSSCLAEMDRYPVNPGTVVLLPTPQKQPKKPVVKKKAPPTPEDQLVRMKRKVWALRTLVVFSIIVIGLLSYITSRVITELDIQRLLGRNYSTIQAEEPTEN